jgi:predicted transposase/invertase (TIGR01784 family)
MRTYKQSVLEYADVRDAMACAREEGFKEGWEEGFKEGFKEGQREERIKFLKNLYKLNMSTEQIIEAMGLTEKEIAELSQSKGFLN